VTYEGALREACAAMELYLSVLREGEDKEAPTFKGRHLTA
jgi:hypothetical protein